MSIRPSLGGGSALPGSRSQPGGYTLVELLIALGIGSLLLTSAYLLYRGSSHLLRLQTLRVEASEARRITRSILGSEIRYLVPHHDLRLVDRERIELRVLRGLAISCAVEADGIMVRYRGIRGPDPEKDSLIVIGAEGRGTLELLASRPMGDSCAGEEVRPGERVYRWGLDRERGTGRLFLLFESGSYHLSEGAFRYWRGASGRQPLTPELFDDERTGLVRSQPALLTLTLSLKDNELLGAEDHPSGRRTEYRYWLGLLNAVR